MERTTFYIFIYVLLTKYLCSRSPWSNEYEPELPDGLIPSPTLRKLEIAANEAFDTYREMYYEGGISSVYAYDAEDKFVVVVLIKKGTHIHKINRLYS